MHIQKCQCVEIADNTQPTISPLEIDAPRPLLYLTISNAQYMVCASNNFQREKPWDPTPFLITTLKQYPLPSPTSSMTCYFYSLSNFIYNKQSMTHGHTTPPYRYFKKVIPY